MLRQIEEALDAFEKTGSSVALQYALINNIGGCGLGSFGSPIELSKLEEMEKFIKKRYGDRRNVPPAIEGIQTLIRACKVSYDSGT